MTIVQAFKIELAKLDRQEKEAWLQASNAVRFGYRDKLGASWVRIEGLAVAKKYITKRLQLLETRSEKEQEI